VSPAVRGFLRSAVAWLVIGLLLGVWMVLDPARAPFIRLAHMHALLPGFVLLMIFGVGYHILPRFSGRPLPWTPGPMVHLVLADLGLALLVGGFLLRFSRPGVAHFALPVGGLLFLAGALLFAHVTWFLTEAPPWQRSKTKGSGTPPSITISP